MYILIDVGGTKTRIARSDDLKRFDDPIVIETSQSYEDELDQLSGQINQLSHGASIRAAVVGCPLRSPKLPGWVGKPFAQDLSRRIGVPVRLENDTALVGLGEAAFGAGQGPAIVAYMTVSTGVNGVRVVNGRIDPSAQGFEVGGQYLSYDRLETLEDLVSGAAIERKFGKHPRLIDRNDGVWEELARVTAFGVHNMILHWSPDVVVLGGSMFNEVGIPVGRVAEHVRDIMKKFPTTPPIVHSALGDLGGLWGGMALLAHSSRS